MKKELEKQLDKYFYGDYCEEAEESERTRKARAEYYKYLNPLMRYDKELFFKIEAAITNAEAEHERQGFLQGYQYALTMLGISSGGTVNGLFGKEHTHE